MDCVQQVNDQFSVDGYYINNCLAAIRTCKILDYFDYSRISRFDKFDTLIIHAGEDGFPYDDIDSYVSELSVDELSSLINKILGGERRYPLALAISISKNARLRQSDDVQLEKLMDSIIHHISHDQFFGSQANSNAVVDLMSHDIFSVEEKRKFMMHYYLIYTRFVQAIIAQLITKLPESFNKQRIVVKI
ncbi:hypothetical protein [Legionella tunisiensis]|uniref:hypothetical protein n=1 Tax=Legionella tunisiensis TaxID=1034944 RepID=UPI0002D428EA|nr:hypothetical protein [Legionella tunisiensis]